MMAIDTVEEVSTKLKSLLEGSQPKRALNAPPPPPPPPMPSANTARRASLSCPPPPPPMPTEGGGSSRRSSSHGGPPPPPPPMPGAMMKEASSLDGVLSSPQATTESRRSSLGGAPPPPPMPSAGASRRPSLAPQSPLQPGQGEPSSPVVAEALPIAEGRAVPIYPRQRTKVKAMQWKKILPKDLKDTIWLGIDLCAFEGKVDFDRIDELFAVAPATLSPASPSEGGGPLEEGETREGAAKSILASIFSPDDRMMICRQSSLLCQDFHAGAS